MKYLCMTCGKEFLTESKLDVHHKVTHEIINRKCAECNVDCKTRSDFDNHVLTKHNAKFVKCKLRYIGDLHDLVKATKLNQNFETRIFKFLLQWDLMQQLYGPSYTLTIHVIEDHLGEAT